MSLSARIALKWLSVVLVLSCAERPPEPATREQEGVAVRAEAVRNAIAVTPGPLATATVSAEAALDPVVLEPGGGEERGTVVASDGTNFLVVWNEVHDVPYSRIFATRVSADGTVLDSRRIPIAILDKTYQDSPSVAFDGTNYFVVWSQSVSSGGYSIMGVRVSPSGTVLDSTPRSIHDCYGNERLESPRIVATSGRLFVLWTTSYGPNSSVNSEAAFVSKEGVSEGTASLGLELWQHHPILVSDGTGVLAVWRKEGTSGSYLIRAQRLLPSGAGNNPFTLGTTPFSYGGLTAAFNGTNYLVAWQDDRNRSAPGLDVSGSRVSASGTLLDASSFALVQGTGSFNSPHLASLGGQFLLAWNEAGPSGVPNAYVTRLDAMGQPLDGPGRALVPAANASSTPALFASATNYLALWHDTQATDLRAARIAPTGSVLDPTGFTVSLGANSQQRAATAFDGTNHLVVWQDDRYGASDILGARVSASGAVLDPAGFVIVRSANRETRPAVAFNGTNFLVVWQTTGTSQAARVSPEGVVLDPYPVTVVSDPYAQGNPSVASDGQQFLVFWDGYGGVRGTRVGADGTVLDPSFITLSTTPGDGHTLIDFDGTNYLVGWHRFDYNDRSFDILGRRVSPAGTVVDASSRLLAGYSNQLGIPEAALAFNGTHHLFVMSDWNWSKPAADDYNLYAVLRSKNLSETGSFVTVSSAPGQQRAPSVTAAGTDFVVTWQDARGGAGWDLYGGRVGGHGVALDGQGVLLSAGPLKENTPVITASSPLQLLLLYQLQDSALGAFVQRMKARSIQLQPNQPPTATPRTVQTREDLTTSVALTGQDADGTVHFFNVTSTPEHGRLSGFPPNLSYIPVENYNGPDSFTFTVSDGQVWSAPATLSLAVVPVNDPPVSRPPPDFSTPEDTPYTFTLTGTDVDGDALRVVFSRRPSHGTISGTAPTYTYTPSPDYAGSDYFEFFVTDEKASSAPHWVLITVTPVEDPPVALAQSLSGQEDTALSLQLKGTDADGDALTYAVASPPGHGSLSGTPPTLTYTPAPDYHGPDSFTFTVSDGKATSAPATVSLSVQPVNDPPVAVAQIVSTPEDTSLHVILTATDVDGDALVFSVHRAPRHAGLTTNHATFSYHPDRNYNGPDDFAFTVSDGKVLSAPATVSVSVLPVNDPPELENRVFSGQEDSQLRVVLTGNDPDGDPVTFQVVSGPAVGTLSGTPPVLTYTPRPDFHGNDQFTITASDGQSTSEQALMMIWILPVNDPPVAITQASSTPEDTALHLRLRGTDVDNDTLSFQLVSHPQHGSLSGTPPALIYMPAPDYHGPDSFTFSVSDGPLTSAPARVSLTVLPVNDAPEATAQVLSTPEDTALDVLLSGQDTDGDALSFAVTVHPSHGSLSGTPPALTYTPAPDYHGPDSFTFTASDGQLTSAPATLSFTVLPVDDAPVATPQVLSTPEDTALGVLLSGRDADGEALSFTVATHPSHGSLSGTPPALTYTPAPDYHGPDSFTFSASDGKLASAPATLSLTVLPVNDAPVAQAATRLVPAGSPTPLLLQGSDVEGGPLSYSVRSPPSAGKLTGVPPEVVYTPPAGFRGTTRFSFSVSDGQAASTAEVVLSVVERSLTVSLVADTRVPRAEQPVRFQSNAVDVAQAPIALEWNFGDGETSQETHPVHAFSAPGTYEVQLKATTGGETATASLHLRVEAARSEPITSARSELEWWAEEGTGLVFQVAEPASELTYTWDFGDGGPTATGSSAQHVWEDEGRFTLTVTARGAEGVRWVSTRAVVIRNAAPVPVLPPALSVTVGAPLSLQLKATDAGAKDRLEWEQVQGEGSVSAEGQLQWTPTKPGVSTLVTRVFDEDGGESRLAFQVLVLEARPPDGPGAEEPRTEEPRTEEPRSCGCGTGEGWSAFAPGMLLLAAWTHSRRRRQPT